MVKMFNGWYFFFILLFAGITVGLYFLLKNKSKKTQKLVLFLILLSNLLLHFLKAFFPPYSQNPEGELINLWFVNLCATSVLFFPFAFISKSNSAKDYVVYLGLISGFLAMFYPTEALEKAPFAFDTLRFYICHYIIFVVPLLTLLLKVHTLDYRRIYKTPFYILAMLIFIVFNQVVASEMGFIPIRNGNFEEINFHNPSLIWGPTDGVAILFSWATPEFMKHPPIGAYQGVEKWWPFFWMVPAAFVIFIIYPFLVCLIVDRKRFFGDVKRLIAFLKGKFTKTKSTDKEDV